MTALQTPSDRPREHGFTIVEAFIVVLILAIVLALGMPALQNLIVRSKLEATAQETAVFFRLARLEAIKRGQPVVVAVDEANNEAFAFVDIHDAAGNPNPDGEFNPVGGLPARATDYRVEEWDAPTWVGFRGPTADPDALSGFTSPPDPPRIFFRPNGSVDDAGALRIADARDNFIEVRIDPALTARIQLRKWHRDDSTWYTRGVERSGGSGKQRWEWYLEPEA